MSAIDGRAAFVTGAAQGLGEAIAAALIAAGARVALCDVNPAVRDTAARLDPAGTRTQALVADVRDEAAFAAAFDQAARGFGAIDVMVNNAARTVVRGVWDITAAEWDDVLAVNLRGAFFGCRIAGRHMRERRRGRIVNMASLAGQQGSLVTGAHYAASKAGIGVITKIFAQELAPSGVTVNAVAPSGIAGPQVDAAPRDKIAAMIAATPVGRLGAPEEVAAAVLYLASDAAGFVTGTTLDINGGRFMR